MSDDSTPASGPDSGSSMPATLEASPASAGVAEPLAPPARRKRKKKVSRDLAALQEVERAASEATHRVARAVEKGVAAYREKRGRSAKRKRDGALRDLPANVAHGVAATVRTASKAPADLAAALDTRAVQKLLRRGIRKALSPFSR